MRKLFVYGTLKKGFYNHYMLSINEPCKFLGLGEMNGFTLYDYKGGGYPLAIKKENASVKGEIYEISEKDFQRIDYMEKSVGYVSEEIGDVLIYYVTSVMFKVRKKFGMSENSGDEWTGRGCFK